MECGLLGRSSLCNVNDRWPRIVDGCCPIQFSCIDVLLHAKQNSVRAATLYQAVCTHNAYKVCDM